MLTPQLLLGSLQLFQLLAQLLNLLLGHLQAVGQAPLLPIGQVERGGGISEAVLPQGRWLTLTTSSVFQGTASRKPSLMLLTADSSH